MDWLRRQVGALTQSQEAARPTPWTVGDAPADYTAAQLKAIVGIEIPIARIEGKWKVSQNRPAADQAGVIAGLRSENADTLAAIVEERGRRPRT